MIWNLLHAGKFLRCIHGLVNAQCVGEIPKLCAWPHQYNIVISVEHRRSLMHPHTRPFVFGQYRDVMWIWFYFHNTYICFQYHANEPVRVSRRGSPGNAGCGWRSMPLHGSVKQATGSLSRSFKLQFIFLRKLKWQTRKEESAVIYLVILPSTAQAPVLASLEIHGWLMVLMTDWPSVVARRRGVQPSLAASSNPHEYLFIYTHSSSTISIFV